MSNSRQSLFAKEGWWHIAIALLAALTATLLLGLSAWPLWLVFLFVLQFFRDPPRTIHAGDDVIIVPADGKVIGIAETTDPYLHRQACKVSIFMNVFSVHSNRAPVSGEVKDIWYARGKFFNAAIDKASSDNERNAVWIRTAADQDVVCVQVAGLIARRILCDLRAGDRIKAGRRYGFIRFGSRVDLYLPQAAQVDVRLGQWVSAGSDIIGSMPSDGASPAAAPEPGDRSMGKS